MKPEEREMLGKFRHWLVLSTPDCSEEFYLAMKESIDLLLCYLKFRKIIPDSREAMDSAFWDIVDNSNITDLEDK